MDSASQLSELQQTIVLVAHAAFLTYVSLLSVVSRC
jgi:hypothetical protein